MCLSDHILSKQSVMMAENIICVNSSSSETMRAGTSKSVGYTLFHQHKIKRKLYAALVCGGLGGADLTAA